MKIERILAMGDTDKGTLSMILSNSIDFFIPEINSAAISVRKFGEVEDDLIKWRDSQITAFRAEVAAALREALAAIAAIPISDYSTDGDAAELVRRDDAADIVRAAMAKLGVTECNNQ